MKCPNDASTLLISDKQGVEIDYCPECRGVWLDRGELDKIIERSDAARRSSSVSSLHQHQSDRRLESDDSHRYKKKKESFLSDLFDF